MLLRMIYDNSLAQAAYLIGCQKSKEAIVIDPERDVDRYLDLAAAEGLRITAVAETHIHADFLSGARELAERLSPSPTIYLSDEGAPDWRSQWLDSKAAGGAYTHRRLRDGDTFSVGAVEFRGLHTPGHTPEHLCYLVTDKGAGATEPMGIITGDFVFVGDLGRPDLLESAAGQRGAKEPAAHELFASIARFNRLPDFLQVWPAHGAGSVCGKALGAVPQSTVGYEKRFNPALRAASDENAFVRFILEGQPEPPFYFARMKRDNKLGPPILGTLPAPPALDASALARIDARRSFILDTRPWSEFRAAHFPGALSAPLDRTFPTIAGSFVEERTPIYLLCEKSQVDEAVRDLVRIGLDDIAGYATPASLREAVARGTPTASIPEIDAEELKRRLAKGAVSLLDVRREVEFAAGHLPGSNQAVHTRLAERLAEIPSGVPIVVTCQSGNRSARACSYLRRAGRDVTNLAGGFLGWAKSGGEVAR